MLLADLLLEPVSKCAFCWFLVSILEVIEYKKFIFLHLRCFIIMHVRWIENSVYKNQSNRQNEWTDN